MPRRQPGCERVLVPLDGSAPAEQVLTHVSALARALGSAVTLLRVVVPASPVLPLAAAPGMPPQARMPDIAPQIAHEPRAAAEYLRGVAGRLAAEMAEVATADEVGQPAEATRDHARQMMLRTRPG